MPLFIKVAESTVIFCPICQVGWFRAWAGFTFESSSMGVSLKGPPEAVR